MTLSDVVSDFSLGSDFDVRRGEDGPGPSPELASTGMLAFVTLRLWMGGDLLQDRLN